MNISFCSIAFRKEKMGLNEIIRLVHKLGYNGIEIWINHISGKEEAAHISDRLRSLGMQASMISPYFDLTADKERMSRSIEHARDCFRLARILDSPLIRVFTGFLGSSEANEESFSQCVTGLKSMCRMAQDYGVKLALETHPKTLTDSTKTTLRLLSAVDEANLGVNLDIYHLWEIGEDPVQAWERLRGKVFNMHAKNARLSREERDSQRYNFLHDKQAQQDFSGIVSLAEGDMDYPAFLKHLKSSAFSGFIAVEWFGPAPEQAAASEIAFLRSIVG